MDNAVLDTAIGLIFVYLLLSLLCSGVQEVVSGVLKRRGKNLREGLVMLLAQGDEHSPFVKGFMDHPLIAGLAKKDGGQPLPSYIPADVFSSVLADVIRRHTGKELQKGSDILGVLEGVENEHLRHALETLARRADGDLEAFMGELENWFDHMTDRISGWYKRRTQLWMFGVALLIAAALNVDTIRIADQLWHDQATRQAVVAMAGQYIEQQPVPQGPEGHGQRAGDAKEAEATLNDDLHRLEKRFDAIESRFARLDLLVGWSKVKDSETEEPSFLFDVWTVPGWLITACFVSLGAPFWFNTLSKALSLRASGARPPRSRPSAKP